MLPGITGMSPIACLLVYAYMSTPRGKSDVKIALHVQRLPKKTDISARPTSTMNPMAHGQHPAKQGSKQSEP